MARLLILLVVAMASVVNAIPEAHVEAVEDLVALGAGEKMAAPEVGDMDQIQFATLMNKIIERASKMRVIMNKLGISDSESAQAVEQHFVNLGQAHRDLGEGNMNEEELRARGLQARSCVKHAMSCSRIASSCHGEPAQCKSVTENCSRAGAACGIKGLGEARQEVHLAEESSAPAHVASKSTAHEELKKGAKPIHVDEEADSDSDTDEDEDDSDADADSLDEDDLDEQLSMVSIDAKDF